MSVPRVVIRRPTTPWVEFATTRRDKLLHDNPTRPPAELGKMLVQEFKGLLPDELVKLEEICRLDRERYERDRAAAGRNDVGEAGPSSSLTLRPSRMRLMMRLDPDVSNVQLDMAAAVAFCTESFLKVLAGRALEAASAQGRPLELRLSDVLHVAQTTDRLAFLRGDLRSMGPAADESINAKAIFMNPFSGRLGSSSVFRPTPPAPVPTSSSAAAMANRPPVARPPTAPGKPAAKPGAPATVLARPTVAPVPGKAIPIPAQVPAPALSAAVAVPAPALVAAPAPAKAAAPVKAAAPAKAAAPVRAPAAAPAPKAVAAPKAPVAQAAAAKSTPAPPPAEEEKEEDKSVGTKRSRASGRGSAAKK